MENPRPLYNANNDRSLHHAESDPAFTRYFVVYRKTLADFQRIWARLVSDAQTIIDSVEETWAELILDGPVLPVRGEDGKLIPKKDVIQLILEKADMDLIGGWSSEPRPGPAALRRDIIRLGGKQPGSDLFYLGPNPCNWSCKTGRRPYDLVVAAVLLRAKHLAGEAIHIEFVILPYHLSTRLICYQLRYRGPRGGVGPGEGSVGETLARGYST